MSTERVMERIMDMDRDQIEGVNGVNSQENSQEFVDTKDTPIETEFTHGMEHEEEATLDGSLSNSIGFERISASTEFQSGEDYDTVEHASNSKVHESTSLETADRLIRNKSNSGVRLASNGQDLEQGVHQASFSIEIVDTGIIEAQSTEPLEACSSKTSENQKVQPVEAVKVELTEQEDQAIEDLFGDTALTSPSPTTDKSQNPMTETAKKVMTLVEGMSTSSTLERAETPKGFAKNIKLHDHQNIGLHWMISREQGRQGGGILADAMGLGKTVSIIALILACPLPGFDKFRQILGWNPDPSMGTVNNGVNLIVAPASLLQQWQKEIETKTSPKLKVLRYDALGKIGVTASCLYRYQAILVSYETLLSDYNKKKKKMEPVFFNSGFKFHRVVLDEGHRIKNRKSQISEACCNLEAVNKWYVSGTPIQNNIEELYPALRFLNVPFFSEWDHFDKEILSLSSTAQSIRKIHNVLHDYLLRRRKNDIIDGKIIIELPKKHDTEYIYASFTPEQMDFYRAFQEKTQLSFIKYLKTSNHRIDFKKALLLRLRQVCLHPWLVNFSKGDDLHKYLLNEQQLVMNACFQFKQSQIQRILSSLKAAEAMSDKFKCESCHEKEVARIIPGCAHCVCPDCIEDIGEDPTMNADEVSLGYCSVCHLQYERLHITTLIGFQCAWVEGFREDDWDRAEAEQEQLVEDPKAVKKAIFDTLKYHLEANDGFLATTKRIDIDPEVWGASNVNSVEEYWEDGDNLSFVVDDDEEDMGMRDYADTNRGSDDNSDGPDDNDDDSSDCEKKRPNKRTFNWEDLDARKRVRYGSDALEGIEMDQETALSSRNTIEITQERSVADGRKFAQATYQDSNDIVYSAVDIEDADMNFRGELEADLSSTTFFNGNHNIETGQAELKFDDFEDQTVSQSDPGSSSELLDFSFNQTDSQKLSDSSMESAIQIEQDYFQDSGLHSKYGISAMNNGSADHPNLQMAYDEADQMASHEPFIKRKIEPRSSINNWEILTETESSEELIGLPESGIMENRMEGSLSIPDPAGIAMDAKMGDPTDSVETIPIPPEKVRMQLKLKFNAKTQHYEYKLPYNLLRLQKSAKQKLENRVRYNKRLINERLPDCAKIGALLEHLEKTQTAFPDDRIIIFSEWVTMLDFIEAVFWNKGKSDYLRYDGNLNTDRKATVVRQFQEVTNNKRILLCSTKAGNCGLNLTAANRIILFEPDYNPYVEDQAVDRCHRIGQKKEVFVTRILVPDTIEAKILELHQRKRRDVDGAIDKKYTKMDRGDKLLDDEFKFLIGLSNSI